MKAGEVPGWRDGVSVSVELYPLLDIYLVFLLTTANRVESARRAIQEGSDTHAVSQSASCTGLPSNLISAT